MQLKTRLAIGLTLAAIATAAFARPPGPDQLGEFYYYFDDSGQTVGTASIDCDGVYRESGVRTNRYSNGYAFCNPD